MTCLSQAVLVAWQVARSVVKLERGRRRWTGGSRQRKLMGMLRKHLDDSLFFLFLVLIN